MSFTLHTMNTGLLCYVISVAIYIASNHKVHQVNTGSGFGVEFNGIRV